MDENVVDINSMRRIRGIEKGIKDFEEQIADLRKCTKILSRHSDFRFYSIMCHELVGKEKELRYELKKLKDRLARYKNETVESEEIKE